MKKDRIVLIVMVVSIGFSVLAGGYILYDKVLGRMIKRMFEERAKTVLKIYDDKSYTMFTQYDYDVLKMDGGGTDGCPLFKVDDIVVPFINIKSDDAIRANADLKVLFDEEILKYNKAISDNSCYVVPKYVYMSNTFDGVFTVGFYSVSKDSMLVTFYRTYAFDIKTGEGLSYKDVYKVAGIKDSDIDKKVKRGIRDYLKEIQLEERFDDGKLEEGVNLTFKLYEDALSKGELGYYLVSDRSLNLMLQIDSGTGFKGTDIVNIKK